QLDVRNRGDEWISVDLSVRVMQGYPHRLAPVLENEDVLDVLTRRQRPIPVRPDLDQQVHPLRGQRAERALVLVGVDDHLAHTRARLYPNARLPRPVARGEHAGKTIFEDGRVEAGRRDLRRMSRRRSAKGTLRPVW